MTTKVDPILRYPNAVLTTACNPVTEYGDNLRALVDAMHRSMYAGEGIGLAANQIGVDARVAVIDLQKKRGYPAPTKLVLINPRIQKISSNKLISHPEGCLSVPGIREYKSRAAELTVCYEDVNGKTHVTKAKGLLARAIQHECDHLDGRLCLSEDALRKYAQSQQEKGIHA